MNTFEILFLTVCGIVALGGVITAIKARKVLLAYKENHITIYKLQ